MATPPNLAVLGQLNLLVDQLRDFPLGDHDDGPDSLEMAVRVLAHFMRPEPVEEYVYT